MRRELVNPIQDLFDAAARHHTIRLDCPRCKRVVIYDGHAVWWLFERKQWPDRLRDVGRHFYCSTCRKRAAERVRPRVSLSEQDPTSLAMAMPDEREWNRALSRRR